MQYAFSEEQETFRSMVRRFLTQTSPTSEVRRLMETVRGFDPSVWARLSQELGVTGLAIPEAYGGAGFGMVELCIVTEEMGRALCCAPFFASSVLAAKAVEHAANEGYKARLLPELASGETIATLAVTEPGGHPDIDAVAMSAEPQGEDFILNGEKKFVLDGCSADVLLVVARPADPTGGSDLSLFEVSPDAAGLTRRPLTTLDPTRKLAELRFDNVKATVVSEPAGAAPGLRHAVDLATIALANEMVGGAERLLQDTIEFTKMRMQFGRSIASFQAIKHRATEMLLAVEQAKSAAYYAAAAVDEQDPELPVLASLAKAAASEAYLHTAIEAIQLHGGIGFTWEQDTHLWFKRAKSSEVLLGDAAWHRERMIQETLRLEQRA